MKKVIPLIIGIALAGPALASCTGSALNEWNYSKADMSKFLETQGRIVNDQGNAALNIEGDNPLVKSNIKIADVKLFNYQNAIKEIVSGKSSGYLDYNVINHNEIKINDIKTNNDCSNITINFNAEENTQYGVLINKKVSANDNYIICVSQKEIGSKIDPSVQTKFEEEYIANTPDIASGASFVWDIACNVAMIVVGSYSTSPTAIATGIIGICNTVFSQFSSDDGPTNAQIMEKLDVIDKKIDGISEKLDKNYEQLTDSINRVAAKVDEVLLNQYTQNITSFVTDYVVPMDNYKRDLGDYIEQSYKSYVSKEERIDMYFEKDSEGNWSYIPTLKQSPTSQEHVSFTIEDFPHAQEFLKKHSNVVGEGFIDELYKDIDSAIANTKLPAGLDRKDARNCAASHIIEQFNQKYYTDNHQKALDLKNMAINYCKRISGRIGTTSVINDYINRFEYMYNFGKEVKLESIDFLANYMFDIDRTVAIAAQACAYAETNNDELANEYLNARGTIKNTYEGIKTIPDSYSFTSKSTLESGFYQAKFNTYYSNPGNSAKLHADFEIGKVTSYTRHTTEPVDIYSLDFVTSEEQSQINARRQLLAKVTGSEMTSYIEYLVNAGGINSFDIAQYNGLVSTGWISNDAYRVATGLTTRALTKDDSNLELWYSAQGTKYSAFFDNNWHGNYRSSHEKDNWNGKIAETTYIDGNTGTVQSNKNVAAYASYYESHWYWSSDEIWAFVDNPAGNYMFILNHKTA